MSSTVVYPMIESTPDGSSRFAEVEFEFAPGDVPAEVPPYVATTDLKPERMVFSEFPAGFEMDWHPAPRRQFIIMLNGVMEVTTGDGDTRRFRSGDVLLVTDTSGQGHQTAAAEGRECVFASIAIAQPGAEQSDRQTERSPS